MLLSTDRQVVPHERRPGTEMLRADLRHVPEVVPEAFPELYWQAPPSYLGDRVSQGIRSGGGTLRMARTPERVGSQEWGSVQGGGAP